MIKFYNVTLLTAGGLSYDFEMPKMDPNSEFHRLIKTGFSYLDLAKTTLHFFQR